MSGFPHRLRPTLSARRPRGGRRGHAACPPCRVPQSVPAAVGPHPTRLGVPGGTARTPEGPDPRLCPPPWEVARPQSRGGGWLRARLPDSGAPRAAAPRPQGAEGGRQERPEIAAARFPCKTIWRQS